MVLVANGVIVITTKGKSRVPQLSYSTSVQFSKMSGDFDVMTPEQFVAAVTIKDQEATTGKMQFYKTVFLQIMICLSQNLLKILIHESLGASSTDGIVKNTGLDKYNATVYNSNDFFGGALKVEERIIYATLKIEQLSCLMTPDLLKYYWYCLVLESNIANL
jgi:iron complex outermembrane receptor protein